MASVDLKQRQSPSEQELLAPDALAFLEGLHERFAERRAALLNDRGRREREIASSGLRFLDETAHIREAEWSVAPAPADLLDRRVEITGPTERKMAINALNSGARVWLADLEDANTPHWANVIGGQVNLYDAVRGTIAFNSPDGREYRLREDRQTATIVVRPRGWHLDERHLVFGAQAAVGALVDFGLYFFHNAAELIARRSGPYFYLPKLESHLEARLWNDVFVHAQEALGIPHGTVRATVLIETIPAAFEMDEILYELRDHASGLNAGRWDYLFSIIKKFRAAGPRYLLGDRNALTMTAPFMRAYTELLVSTCHRRGAFAIGGMAAFIPSRRDPEVNAVALAKVRDDKEREARDGFDGSWVAHPDLVGLCEEVFDATFGERPNQLARRRDDVHIEGPELLALGDPLATAAGLRSNIDVGVRYLESWLRGTGAAAIHNLMEDTATAEISRSQIWQWIHNAVVLDNGTTVTTQLVRQETEAQIARVREDLGVAAWAASRFATAGELFLRLVLDDGFEQFLTLPAYELID